MQRNGGNKEKVLVFLSLYTTMNDEEKLAELKEKAMKCKVISLDLLGFHPLQNPSLMCPRDKNKVIKQMEEWFKKEEEGINVEFNDIVTNKVLHSSTDVL